MKIENVNLAAVDLNLLVIFDALYRERSVTRAGERVGLGQSSVSHALNRLRRQFGDELFNRTPDGMQPTPIAVRIAPTIRAALEQLRGIYAREEAFDPATARRLFRLGLPDEHEMSLVPRLVGLLHRTAPAIEIQCRSVDRERALRMLDDDEIDLAIGVFPAGDHRHKRRVLFEADFLCLYDPAQVRVTRPISLDDYLAYGHVLVSLREDREGQVDALLAARGRARRVVVSTPRFHSVPFILKEAPLIAMMPRRIAQRHATAHGLVVDPPPLLLPSFEVSMLWHASHGPDPAHVWLRDTLGALVSSTRAAGTPSANPEVDRHSS